MRLCLWLVSDSDEKCAFRLLPFFQWTTENVSEELGMCHCPMCGLWTGDIFQDLSGFSVIDEIWDWIPQCVVEPQTLGLLVGNPTHLSQGFLSLGWASLIWGSTDGEQPHFPTHLQSRLWSLSLPMCGFGNWARWPAAAEIPSCPWVPRRVKLQK